MSLSPKAISILEEARDLVTLIRLIDGDFDPINLGHWVTVYGDNEEIRSRTRQLVHSRLGRGGEGTLQQEIYDYFKTCSGRIKFKGGWAASFLLSEDTCKTAATLYFFSLEYENIT